MLEALGLRPRRIPATRECWSEDRNVGDLECLTRIRANASIRALGQLASPSRHLRATRTAAIVLCHRTRGSTHRSEIAEHDLMYEVSQFDPDSELLAFDLLTGARAPSRDVQLHADKRCSQWPVGRGQHHVDHRQSQKEALHLHHPRIKAPEDGAEHRGRHRAIPEGSARRGGRRLLRPPAGCSR